MNQYRINQWKKQLDYVMMLIGKERRHLELWFVEGVENNLEFATKLHGLYKRADEICGWIIDERDRGLTKGNVLFSN